MALTPACVIAYQFVIFKFSREVLFINKFPGDIFNFAKRLSPPFPAFPSFLSLF
jgi:hypothetical protein